MKIHTSPLRGAPKVRKLWACFGVLSLLFITPASAQSLVGTWSTTSQTDAVSGYMFLRFNSNGVVQGEMGVADLQQRGGSGTTRCSGAYQFNGQMLAMRWSACQACGAAGCYPVSTSNATSVFGGPFSVRFMNNSTVDIGGQVYNRQQ